MELSWWKQGGLHISISIYKNWGGMKYIFVEITPEAQVKRKPQIPPTRVISGLLYFHIPTTHISCISYILHISSSWISSFLSHFYSLLALVGASRSWWQKQKLSLCRELQVLLRWEVPKFSFSMIFLATSNILLLKPALCCKVYSLLFCLVNFRLLVLKFANKIGL